MGRAHARLAGKIHRALLEDRRTCYERVRAIVEGNTVILTGTARDARTRHDVEQIARQVGGGLNILNNVELTDEGTCFSDLCVPASSARP